MASPIAVMIRNGAGSPRPISGSAAPDAGLHHAQPQRQPLRAAQVAIEQQRQAEHHGEADGQRGAEPGRHDLDRARSGGHANILRIMPRITSSPLLSMMIAASSTFSHPWSVNRRPI